MLTSYLSDVSEAGETAAEFIGLYEKLIAANHWKYYLTVRTAAASWSYPAWSPPLTQGTAVMVEDSGASPISYI